MEILDQERQRTRDDAGVIAEEQTAERGDDRQLDQKARLTAGPGRNRATALRGIYFVHRHFPFFFPERFRRNLAAQHGSPTTAPTTRPQHFPCRNDTMRSYIDPGRTCHWTKAISADCETLTICVRNRQFTGY